MHILNAYFMEPQLMLWSIHKKRRNSAVGSTKRWKAVALVQGRLTVSKSCILSGLSLWKETVRISPSHFVAGWLRMDAMFFLQPCVS